MGDMHCGYAANAAEAAAHYQFKTMFEDMYDNETLGNDWMGILGNNDYGGKCFTKGWDQQIFYTWTGSERWVMPAQYWKRRVQFAEDFTVDFFFLDTNRA